MGRLFQGAATVDSILRGDLVARAADAGLRSLFVGFETLAPANLARSNKRQNLGRDYAEVARRLHGLGIMINGSFVFGMDEDDESVFRRTVDWAIEHGITTATFHIQTPYPGTRLFARTDAAGRILTRDWDLYDTRHVVYQPARLTPEALKRGYDWAYREFYRWSSIARGSLSHGSLKHQAKHFFYAAGWKKFEPLWDVVIRAKQLALMTPMLEGVLSKVTAEAPVNPSFDLNRHEADVLACLESYKLQYKFKVGDVPVWNLEPVTCNFHKLRAFRVSRPVRQLAWPSEVELQHQLDDPRRADGVGDGPERVRRRRCRAPAGRSSGCSAR